LGFIARNDGQTRTTEMSDVQAPAVQATPAVAPTTAKPNAIQLLEAELVGFVKQKEQAIANLHVLDGAIQATQLLIGKLRAEAAKAEAEAKKLVDEAIAGAEHLATEAESKVVSIAEAVEKKL
jgi:hypothetical protein